MSQHAKAICTTQLHALLIREGLMLILFSDGGWRIWENVFSLNLPHTPCASSFRRITFMKRIALIRSRRQHRVFSCLVGSMQLLYFFASVWPCTSQWMHNATRQTLDAIVLPCDHSREIWFAESSSSGTNSCKCHLRTYWCYHLCSERINLTCSLTFL